MPSKREVLGLQHALDSARGIDQGRAAVAVRAAVLVRRARGHVLRKVGVEEQSASELDEVEALGKDPIDALVETVLARTEGNQIRAAALLGINRNTLRKKIVELGVAVPSRS